MKSILTHKKGLPIWFPVTGIQSVKNSLGLFLHFLVQYPFNYLYLWISNLVDLSVLSFYLVEPIIVHSYSSANEFVGFPICPGFDVSGEVIYAGSEVTDLRPGDKVFGCTFFGAYSTKVRVM